MRPRVGLAGFTVDVDSGDADDAELDLASIPTPLVCAALQQLVVTAGDLSLCSHGSVGIPDRNLERRSESNAKLKEQGDCHGRALDALQRQINPHFLSIRSASIACLCAFPTGKGVDCEACRLLRTPVKDRDDLMPLREELQFADDYLDIEVVRFGIEKAARSKGYST